MYLSLARTSSEFLIIEKLQLCDADPEITVLHTLLHLAFLVLTRVLGILLCNHFLFFYLCHQSNAF